MGKYTEGHNKIPKKKQENVFHNYRLKRKRQKDNKSLKLNNTPCKPTKVRRVSFHLLKKHDLLFHYAPVAVAYRTATRN